MQDIRSILESLHAIEADLVHTNDEADLVHTNDRVVSLQAHSDVPAHLAAGVIWDAMFNDYLGQGAKSIQKSDWNKKRTWDQAKIFLKCYKAEYQPKTDEAIARTKKCDEAMGVLETITYVQLQHKQNMETTRQSLLACYRKTKLIDADGGNEAWNTLVEYNKELLLEFQNFENSRREFMDDLEISQAQIIDCKETLTGFLELCTTLHNLDVSRSQLFKIITEEAENLDLKKQQNAVKNYGEALIKEATDYLKAAEEQEQVSHERLEKIKAQKKSVSNSDKTINSETKNITIVSEEIDKALEQVKKLIDHMKKTLSPPEPATSPLEPATSPLEPATSDLTKKNDELQVLQHALVEQQVVLAQDALQQAHAQHAASSSLAEQTLQADHAKVEMEQQHLEEAQQKVADVQEEMHDTLTAIGKTSAPAGTVMMLLNELAGALGLATDKVVVVKQEVVVAESTLEADLAKNKEQDLHELHNAQALSTQCLNTARVTLTQAKQDIKYRLDEVLRASVLHEEFSALQNRLVEAEEEIQTNTAKKLSNLVQISQKNKDKLVQIIAEKQQEMQSNDRKADEADVVLKESTRIYYSARQVFLDAFVAQSALFQKVYPDQTPPPIDLTDLPDSIEALKNEYWTNTRAAQTQAKTEDNTAHAAVATAQNTLANNMQHLQALVKTLPADAPGPDQASVSPQQQYDALAQVARNLIEDAEETLEKWLEILDTCAFHKAQADYYKGCVDQLQGIQKKYESSSTNKYTGMLQEQLLDNEKRRDSNHDAYTELMKPLREGEKILNNAILLANNQIDIAAAFAKTHSLAEHETLKNDVQKQDVATLFGTKTVFKLKVIRDEKETLFATLLNTIETGLSAPQAPDLPAAAAPPAVDATDALSAVLAQYEAALLEFQTTLEDYCRMDIYVKWLIHKGTEWQSQLQRLTEEAGKYGKQQTTYTARQGLIGILTTVIATNKQDYTQAKNDNTSVTYKKLNADQHALQQAIATVNSTIDKLIENDSADTDKVRELEARLIPTRVILSEEVFEKRKQQQQELDNGGPLRQLVQEHVQDYTAQIAAAEAKIADADKDLHDRIELYNQHAVAADNALKAAWAEYKLMDPLCEEVAELELARTREQARIDFFKKPLAKAHIVSADKKAAIKADCETALLQIIDDYKKATALRQSAEIALTAATEAAEAALTLVRRTVYNSTTENEWIQRRIPEPFNWRAKLQVKMMELQKLRRGWYQHKEGPSRTALTQYTVEEKQLVAAITKFQDADEKYLEAVEIDKVKKAAFAINQSLENTLAAEKAVCALEDTQHAQSSARAAETEQEKKSTAAKDLAIKSYTELLLFTDTPEEFQSAYVILDNLKQEDIVQLKMRIKQKRAKDAAHTAALALRETTIKEASLLNDEMRRLSAVIYDLLPRMVKSFQRLHKTTQCVTHSQVQEYNNERRAFDTLHLQLQQHVEAYNKVHTTWLRAVNSIVNCTESSFEDTTKKRWLQVLNEAPKDFDVKSLLKGRNIQLDSILAMQAEPDMQGQPTASPSRLPTNIPVLLPTALPRVEPAAQPQVKPPHVEPSLVKPSTQDVPSDLDRRVERLRNRPHDDHDEWRQNSDKRPNNDDPSFMHFTHSLSPPPACSFKQSFLAFAARLLGLVYPPVPAKAWLDRPPVARYAHPDRAGSAGSLELHALCARVAHIAFVVQISEKFEPLAAQRFLVELPENARLLVLAVSALPAATLYAARAAPSREHPNAAAIRACLSRASLAPLRACAEQTVAPFMPKKAGGNDEKFIMDSTQYV